MTCLAIFESVQSLGITRAVPCGHAQQDTTHSRSCGPRRSTAAHNTKTPELETIGRSGCVVEQPPDHGVAAMQFFREARRGEPVLE